MATQDGLPVEVTPSTSDEDTERPVSPATDVASLMEEDDRYVASTPMGEGRPARPSTLSDLSPCVPGSPSSVTPTSELTLSLASSTQTDLGEEDHLQVPVLGYEVMEERARFTVFKIQVKKGRHDSWFLFRRYSDFVRLNDQLKKLFPHFRLSLPPKNWFGDNFNNEFLEDRLLGLQAFINNIIGHRDVGFCEPVRLFFCLDDPPGPHDSLEESRALCDELENQVFSLKHDLRERDEKITLLEDEVALNKVEIENLKRALRIERSMQRRCSPSSQPSECSLPEHEQEAEPQDPPTDRLNLPSTSKIAALVDCNAKKLSQLKVADPLPTPSSDVNSSEPVTSEIEDKTDIKTDRSQETESQNSLQKTVKHTKHKELEKEYFSIPEALSE